jgi:hypothetical protein
MPRPIQVLNTTWQIGAAHATRSSPQSDAE